MLSYRKETVLQGALVVAKSGRPELRLRDNTFTDTAGLSVGLIQLSKALT